MKTFSRLTSASLALLLALALAPHALNAARAGSTTAAQDATAALQRGYRTGYSDGYQAGFADTATRAPRDFRGKPDYQRAERAYAASYGPLEDYRDGYRQGFEAGYAAGYERRSFDSTVPAGIARRGAAADPADAGARDEAAVSTSGGDVTGGTATRDDDPAVSSSSSRDGGAQTAGRNYGSIPAGTMLRVELSNRLSTDVSFRGDPFEARVVEPREFAGAILSGRVASVKRAGKVKGSSELQLSFYQVRLPDGRYEDFSGQVVEVLRAGDEAGVGEVDPEGGVRGQSTTKDDVAKVGAGAGIGAIIGAIAGGGKGAAIGAAIGGGAATGGVMTQRGKDIRLERGQQLMVRASR